MYFIYSLLLGLAFLILLPRFLFDAFRHGKYVTGFRERMGALSPIVANGRPLVWIHCVSVGETQAAQPLVQRLKERFPETLVAVSTITVTGQNLAREIFKNDAVKVFYFPFDWRCVVRRTLRAIKPNAVVVMETELWPGFLRECHEQQIPVALVNGRLSEQSFRRYRLIKGFMGRVLQSLHLAVMQTEADAGRLRALGMDAGKTIVSGSLKFDAGTIPASDSLTREFRERFDFSDRRLLILAASTHAPEERVVLDAFKQILVGYKLAGSESAPRLMIAPRHPERFAEVAALIEDSGLCWARGSADPTPGDVAADVILLDSIGELRSVYSLAPIVFVGGSIARTGGHNILEPAAVAAGVITGPHTFNFQLIVETFVKANAIVQLPQMYSDLEATQALANEFSKLLADPAVRRELGERARDLVNANRGATERTLQSLIPILARTASDLEPERSLNAPYAPIA
jgi:3-deoxy-D-manno-octulosonic-acid transferase